MSAYSAFPLPPKDYNQEYMNRLVRQLEITLRRLHAGQPIRAGSDRTGAYVVSALTLEDIPTSPTGLPSGSVWSDGGTLKIVS